MGVTYLDKKYVKVIPGSTPNCSSRGDYVVDAITLHYTVGLGAKGSAKWGQSPDAKSSAHFYVDRDGSVLQLVPLDKRAWHHGKSEFEYQKDILTPTSDYCSVGIEISNCGPVVKRASDNRLCFSPSAVTDGDNVSFVLTNSARPYPESFPPPVTRTLKFSNGKIVKADWEPYRDVQVSSVVTLVSDLVTLFSIPLSRIVGHEDVATPLGERKFDPGPMWDWVGFLDRVQESTGVTTPNNLWRLHKTTVIK